MESIIFPPCDEELAAKVLGLLLAAMVVGAMLSGLFKKLHVSGAIGTTLALLISIAVAGSGYVMLYTNQFTEVVVTGDEIKFVYPPPSPAKQINARNIVATDINANLRSRKQSRLWQHQLQLKTDDGKDYESVMVCIDRDKVGPDYPTVTSTKLNDSVERAQNAIEMASIESYLKAPDAKATDPNKYARMLVHQMRIAQSDAFGAGATAQSKQAALQKLDTLRTDAVEGLGDRHYLVGLIDRFVGSVYGHDKDLATAKIYFGRADKIQSQSGDQAWSKINGMIHPGGLTLNEYEHPDWPKTPMSAVQW